VEQSCPLVSSSGVLDFGVNFWTDLTAEMSDPSASASACSYPSLFRHHPPSPRDFLRWGKRVRLSRIFFFLIACYLFVDVLVPQHFDLLIRLP
jgi:hypothetical protein